MLKLLHFFTAVVKPIRPIQTCLIPISDNTHIAPQNLHELTGALELIRQYYLSVIQDLHRQDQHTKIYLPQKNDPVSKPSTYRYLYQMTACR